MSKLTFEQIASYPFLVKAILDDYCNLVAKIENIHSDQVRKRINDRAELHFNEFKKTETDKSK